jgi:hypothetical protein
MGSEPSRSYAEAQAEKFAADEEAALQHKLEAQRMEEQRAFHGQFVREAARARISRSPAEAASLTPWGRDAEGGSAGKLPGSCSSLDDTSAMAPTVLAVHTPTLLAGRTPPDFSATVTVTSAANVGRLIRKPWALPPMADYGSVPAALVRSAPVAIAHICHVVRVLTLLS